MHGYRAYVYRSVQHSYLDIRAIQNIEKTFFNDFDPLPKERVSSDNPKVKMISRGELKWTVESGGWALKLCWMCPLFVGTVSFDGDLQAFHADLL